MTTTPRSEAARRFLDDTRPRVERALDQILPPPTQRPARLHDAMRYAVFGKGKRLRPCLSVAAGRAADDQQEDERLIAACGLELLHTYSLVHDDLPALDDDDLRRGRPTTHVAYDEALAILVGDALLTFGLEVLATHPDDDIHARRRQQAFAEVVRAIGTGGMIGGQVEDLEQTGHRDEDRHDDRVDRLSWIHRAKTGCLITASLLHGAILAGINGDPLTTLRAYGHQLGLAFQISDDILDVTGTSNSLGKSAGKDADQGKLTYPALYGLDRSRQLLEEARQQATELAEQFEGRGGLLASFAALVAERST